MNRYIDAEKVMKEINRIGGHNLCEWETIGVKALIDRQPTADVVEVVRCKDCKYLMFSDCYGECARGHLGIVNPDDYCSYGERKDNE